MCSTSGFFEQFFPLIRAVNQTLPAEKRLRVLAGDPPIDWDQVKSLEDFRSKMDRDPSIAGVVEREVLAKHRKALMLFGTLHLLHGWPDAVSSYEKDYPNATFVISDLGSYDPRSSRHWRVPSLIRTKGTRLGELKLSDIFPPPVTIDADCRVTNDFPKEMQRPTADLLDAFLYLGPPNLRFKEPMPADIALDADYMAELQRRDALTGFPGTMVLP